MITISSIEILFFGICIFTFLIDLIDLRIYTKSFSFLISFTYFFYFIIRLLFGFAALSLLSTTNLVGNMDDIQTMVLLPMVSVITSITLLQNFAATIGHKDIINLPQIFHEYKETMIEEIAKKDFDKNVLFAEKKAAKLMKLASDLTEKVPLEILRRECIFVLNVSYKKDVEKQNQSLDIANKYIEKQETIVTDSTLLQKLYAYEIVNKNSKYGELLLDKHKDSMSERNISSTGGVLSVKKAD